MSANAGGVRFDPQAEANNTKARASAGVSAPPGGNVVHAPNKRRSMAMAKSIVSNRIQSSEFYHSLLAERLRCILNGKIFTVLMVMSLVIALLLPDIFTIAAVNSNLAKDITLCAVMMIFIFELSSLSFVDATYVLSFFWFMDFLGTISMVFDISFFLGSNTQVPRMDDGSGAKKNFVLVRAARLARVGARAGRLSRVLRMLKFLPCFNLPEKDAKSSRGIAVVISNQLANSVAIRVACLTILLVMVIPLFDVLSFPQSDYALQTWVNRLTISYRRKHHSSFYSELGEMVKFFKDVNYGPYAACHGHAAEGGGFICRQHVTDWKPMFSEPPRMASALLVHSDSFMVSFNMDGPIKFESCFSIMNVFFITFAMVGSGLALSNVVTDLAVKPLERMLMTVRQIASTVFKFSQDLENDDQKLDEDEEAYDVDGTSEMELLERVVQKLAVVAELQTKHDMDQNEDMRHEDLGILSMMHGKAIESNEPGRRRSGGGVQMQAARKKVAVPSKALEDIGISYEVYESLAFNIMPLNKNQRLAIAFFTIAHFHSPGDGFIRTQDEKACLKRFINAAEKLYPPNPFHNFAHATDCVHMVARQLRKLGSDEFLSELEQFSLLVAGISHDLGHPGVNNGFLSEVGHELALQYNDRSPLENMHCAKLYTIVAEEETNVFGKMTREQYKEVRKHCIETILHTDMMTHQQLVKDLQMTYQMNSEAFAASSDPGSLGWSPRQTGQAQLEVFCQSDTKVIIMNTMLHAADVSNPCRAWETASGWGMKVIEEFFAQGDEERRLGIPVQFLNDRFKLNKPNSQIGFIEFMIAPFVFAQIKLWPGLEELGEELVKNLEQWETMWLQEVSPSDEERQKVRARVEKVTDGLEDAKRRG